MIRINPVPTYYRDGFVCTLVVTMASFRGFYTKGSLSGWGVVVFDYQVLELTNEEAWAIDFCVRQSDHGKPWGDWGEDLLRKVFVAIGETEGKSDSTAIVLLNGQELWAIENQVRHLYREGPVPVGRNLLRKVQVAILALSSDLFREEVEEDASSDTRAGTDPNR